LQNDPISPATENNDMKFDDINLNDDKTAPKLDLDFGLSGSGASEKKSGGGFSFGGGWGGGWGSTGASWGFGGAEEKEKAETKVDDSWNFSTKKDKSKKNSAFDFNFDTQGEDDIGMGAKDETPADDPW
jgi:hypothetical protein